MYTHMQEASVAWGYLYTIDHVMVKRSLLS